jgi:amidase
VAPATLGADSQRRLGAPGVLPELAATPAASPASAFVPRMYINADPDAGTSEKPGIGGPTGQRIHTRAR